MSFAWTTTVPFDELLEKLKRAPHYKPKASGDEAQGCAPQEAGPKHAEETQENPSQEPRSKSRSG